MPVVRIEDPDDPRVVELRGLTDAAARRSVEAEHGCFVAEGLLTLQTIVETGHRIRTLLVDDRKLDRVRALVAADATVLVGSRALLESVTGFSIHRGVVASVDRPRPSTADDVLARADRALVVEGVNDHENIGSLFRVAAAFGAAVVIDATCSDPLYRRSVRVSLGHVLRVPWARVDDAPSGVERCRDAGFRALALSPAGTTSVHDVEPTGPVAWIVGAEGPGLTDATMAAADVIVRIPIEPDVDSLNVATAAAIGLSRTRP